MKKLFLKLGIIFILSCFKAYSGIIVPVTYVLAINGETPFSHTFYNDSLGVSDFSESILGSSLIGSADVASNNYLINGGIYTNCENGSCSDGLYVIQARVQPLSITLNNATSQIIVDLRGQIGSQNLSDSYFNIDFINSNTGTLPYRADIQIVGDLKETSINSDSETGTYTGTFTISAAVF